MNVFGHYYVSDYFESVALADLFEDSEKRIARTGRTQKRLATIAAGGDEMQIAATVNASEASGHGSGLYKSEVPRSCNRPRRPPSERRGG